MRTMTTSLVAATAVSALLTVVRVAEWLVASPWHIALVCGIGGAVVVARRKLRPAPQHPVRLPTPYRPVRRERKAAMRVQPAMRPLRPSAAPQPRREPVYLGRERIGWMDANGAIRLDRVVPYEQRERGQHEPNK